ncbi:ATP-dependent protease [Endozoicomonas sp. (ex Bugula neritina AB1)]|nr:ATP-dependent protease [Endozoicomonas sp. (ex Bugula neritina AB1)]
MSRLAVVNTRAQAALNAPAVLVEVHLSAGLPGLSIVGLPEASVRESKDRVRSALINSGYEFPEGRITVNLAPADLPKDGSRFDLPIAVGILAASGQIPTQGLSQQEFLGELALTGKLRPISAILPASVAAGKVGRELILPTLNADLAAMANGTKVIAARSISEVCAYINQKAEIAPTSSSLRETSIVYPDLADVQGQQQAKRALMTAAAGGHHALFFGAPGTGKTMLASRLPGILPPLTEAEALEVASIHSLTTHAALPNWQQRPFRAPHHSSSPVSLVGGGSLPRPGEITFSHHGVLFLDEMPEFQRQALEILREPLESGEVVITRARYQETYPANFQLVAAMNPCPCGFLGSSGRECRCSPDQVSRYRNKISGPLLDRIDLQVEVSAQSTATILEPAKPDTNNECSRTIRNKVIEARNLQINRQGKINSKLTPTELHETCQLGHSEKIFMTRVCDKLNYSARAVHRVLKVARTLADLEGVDRVKQSHLAEAIQYRKLDRQAK